MNNLTQSAPDNHSAIKEVIVMCHASSGSSCVAGILHRLGVNMGSNLKNAQRLNPKGFYEDEDFFSISGKIWTLYHLQSRNRSTLNHSCLLNIGEQYRSDFKTLIRHRQNQGGHWGVKEPRLSLLVPIFQPFLLNPFFIVVERDMASHVNSRYNKINTRFSRQRLSALLYYLKKGHIFTLVSHVLNNVKSIGMTKEDMARLVTSFYSLIDAIVINQPHMRVNFDVLLAQPEYTINEIICFLSLQPTREQVDAAIAFIAPELRHYA